LKPITLAATFEGLPPEATYRRTKTAKTYQVSRHRVVIEVAPDHPSKPLPLSPDGLMTSAFQLIPNSQQRRTHSLLDRQSQYLKATASVGTATVREAQEVNPDDKGDGVHVFLGGHHRPYGWDREGDFAGRLVLSKGPVILCWKGTHSGAYPMLTALLNSL